MHSSPTGRFGNPGLSNSVCTRELWVWVGLGMVVFCCYSATIGMGEGLVVGGLVPILRNWHVYPDVATASGGLVLSALAPYGRGR